MFNFFAVVPGLKMLNRLGGAIFGFLEGGLFIGMSLQFISRLPISDKFAQTIADSQFGAYFLKLTAWLVPLFPSILKNATDAVDKYLPK